VGKKKGGTGKRESLKEIRRGGGKDTEGARSARAQKRAHECRARIPPRTSVSLQAGRLQQHAAARALRPSHNNTHDPRVVGGGGGGGGGWCPQAGPRARGGETKTGKASAQRRS